MNGDLIGIGESVEVVNVVATGEFRGTVNLEDLFAAAEKSHVRYDPVHHQGCYIRFREDGPLITVYHSGKYIIRAESVDAVHKQDKKLINYLQKIGVPRGVDQKQLEISNIVGISDLEREIDVNALVEDLPYADHNKDLPGGRTAFKYPNTHSTISMFRTGKVMIMGGKSVEEVNQVWKSFTRDLKELLRSEKKSDDNDI